MWKGGKEDVMQVGRQGGRERERERGKGRESERVGRKK